MNDTNPSPAREFTLRLADLLRREHGALADFLVALADFDRQRLWLRLGFASLFDFLHRELGLSRGAAHYRKVAARSCSTAPRSSGRSGTDASACPASSRLRRS